VKSKCPIAFHSIKRTLLPLAGSIGGAFAVETASPKTDFPLQPQRDLPCPVLPEKIFHFACRANHNYKPAPSRASHEGRFAIVTKRWARDAMDASAATANEVEADGEAAWFWHPLAGAKPAGQNLPMMICRRR
jgi:hypothetical protein